MVSAKLKLNTIVSEWERNNQTQYLAYAKSRKLKTDNLANKFAETPGGGFILRLLYELPEDLDFNISKCLEDAELQWLHSDQGGKWFAKTFKQYNVSQKS